MIYRIPVAMVILHHLLAKWYCSLVFDDKILTITNIVGVITNGIIYITEKRSCRYLISINISRHRSSKLNDKVMYLDILMPQVIGIVFFP